MAVRCSHAWVMESEDAAEAPQVLHQLECVSCSSQSACHEDQVPALDWAFAHIQSNPSHRGYREHVTRFWRLTALDASTEQQP